MTGRELALEAILDGRLKVQHHPDTGIRILSWHRQSKHWRTITPHPHPRSGRMRIVYGKRRQPVYLNVLIWMCQHRRLPDGHIDHKDGDRLNDAPDNLQEQSCYDSHRQGREVQADKELTKALAFFGYIQFWGNEPEAEEIVPDWYATYEGPAMISVLSEAVRPTP